jgi:hypothetical protein
MDEAKGSVPPALKRRSMGSKVSMGLVAAVLLVGVTGCGDSGATDARIAKLERRVSNVERQNAALRAALTSERRTFRATLAGIYANDEALYTGVAMAQDGVVCNRSPACHVPLGEPGAVYTEDGKPHQIFATPFP